MLLVSHLLRVQLELDKLSHNIEQLVEFRFQSVSYLSRFTLFVGDLGLDVGLFHGLRC